VKKKDADAVEHSHTSDLLVTTLMWTPDGKLLLTNSLKEGSQVFDDYPAAQDAFVENIMAIDKSTATTPIPYNHYDYIRLSVNLYKDGWDAKNETDRDGVVEFLTKSAMAIQFVKIGTSAYVLHNAEIFKFISSLDGIESLVYDLFFAVPQKKPPSAMPKFQDPEVEKMLAAMLGSKED
jgi:hypothetical protein